MSGLARTRQWLLAIALWTTTFAAAAAQGEPTAALVQRGAYLAKAADCVACHTAPGGTPYAGGYPVSTPFGTIYGPNITADRGAGIGGWSDAQFLRAVRQGIGAHGEYLYPAMPFASYAKMHPADVLAIKAFLFSLPAVHRPTPANKLLFPLGFRPVLWGWRLFNPLPREIANDPMRSDEWNRGRYLVEAAEHCGECHSPRTLTEGENKHRYLGGASLSGWTAYNITPDPNAGIGAWSTADITQFLGTGRNRWGSASGPMAEAVSDSTHGLSPADLQAMAVYLKTAPAIGDGGVTSRSMIGGPASPAVDLRGGPVQESGAELFVGNCASCHGWDGAGRGQGHGAYPSLFHHSSVGAHDPDNLVQVILNGVQRTDANGPIAMPAFADQLDDAEIAKLATYVRATFGRDEGAINPGLVAKLRRGPSIAGLAHLEIAAAILVLIFLLAGGMAWTGMRRRRERSA